MIKLTKTKLIFSIISCFTLQTTALADDNRERDRGKNACDVVSLNGTGQLLPGGRIVGKETLTIIGTEKQVEVEFTTIPLGALKVEPNTGTVTLGASHDFAGVNNRKINFTTFDEIKVIPLVEDGVVGDANCRTNPCGLIFKLKLEKGHGKYNCGEIVSGFNTDPDAQIPFTSYVIPSETGGDTVTLNSIGKLCKCN